KTARGGGALLVVAVVLIRASPASPADHPPSPPTSEAQASLLSLPTPIGAVRYTPGHGLRVGDTGLTLAGYGAVDLLHEEGGATTFRVENADLFVIWDPLARRHAHVLAVRPVHEQLRRRATRPARGPGRRRPRGVCELRGVVRRRLVPGLHRAARRARSWRNRGRRRAGLAPPGRPRHALASRPVRAVGRARVPGAGARFRTPVGLLPAAGDRGVAQDLRERALRVLP